MVMTPPPTVQEEAETEDDRRDNDNDQQENTNDANDAEDDQDDMTETMGDTSEVTDMTATQNMDMTPMMPMQHAIEPLHSSVDDPPQSFMRMLSVFDFSYKGASTAASINNGNLPLTLPQDPTVNHAPGHWTPMGAQLEFDAAAAAGSLDLDFDHLDEMDFRFLDAYNTRVPFEFGVSPTGDASLMTTNRPELTSSTSPPAHNALASSSSAIGTGSEAFQRHCWKFRPNAQDHCGAEEHNLSLPSASVVVDRTSPDSPLAHHSHVAAPTTHTRLSMASRDKILMVVTHNCKRENVARVVTSFPSVELLDTLLQFYLTSPVAQASAWLHTPSFHDNPNDRRPELLAAMAAAGAVLTADSALSKLGFAIQECLRIAVPQQWGRDSSLTRDLELGQAYLLTLDMGLWSGRSRKVEIAENFFLPLLTIRRRDGSFGRPKPTPHAVRDSDEGDLLVQKWRAWIHREAVTRFTFRILQHDTNTSMALLTTPLVSYAEVLLAFPAPEALWGASSAEQWKQLYLAVHDNSDMTENTMPATLPSFLEHPEAFLAAHRGRIDMGVVCSTFLSCAWGLTWEYVQMRVLQREMAATTSTTLSLLPGRRWNALAMGARQDEILQLVQSFRMATASLAVSDPTLAMRTELVLMHTHTVLEQVQLFAGMEGRDEARAVHPVIVEWVASEAARTSLWHAGQILRGARLLARGVVSGPTAVMVYHAGLTLWIYGSVAASLPDGHEGGEDVLLDGDATPSLQRFFVRGQGRPCISSENDEVIPLSRPDCVMAVVAGLFRRNHGKAARPHMVESLIQLLDEIQRASAEASLV